MPQAGELRAEGVVKNFAGLRALDGVDLSLRPGEIVGLIGPNGSGKTTLLNVISGLFAASEGRILIDGRDATRWPAHDVARAGIGRTFQNIRLFGQLSVLENVEISARAAPSPGAGFDPHAFALQLLSRFGLTDLADRPASALDYGAQRRLEIARALALRPRYLLLDEPGAGMNPTESNELLRDLAGLRDDDRDRASRDRPRHVAHHAALRPHRRPEPRTGGRRRRAAEIQTNPAVDRGLYRPQARAA